jgi:hypothetical protein
MLGVAVEAKEAGNRLFLMNLMKTYSSSSSSSNRKTEEPDNEETECTPRTILKVRTNCRIVKVLEVRKTLATLPLEKEAGKRMGLSL